MPSPSSCTAASSELVGPGVVTLAAAAGDRELTAESADRHTATDNRRPDRPPAAHPSFSRERAGWPANDSGNRRRRRTAGTSQTMDHLRGARGGGGTEPSRQRRLRLSIRSVSFFISPGGYDKQEVQPIDELASDPARKRRRQLTTSWSNHRSIMHVRAPGKRCCNHARNSEQELERLFGCCMAEA